MCPQDDSHLTLEFDDHYVITPSIKYNNSINNFTTNNLGEKGVFVEKGFEYNSGSNTKFLTVEELKKYN